MILAVDGGNSKTDVVLVGDDGALLGQARGPLSSPHHLGLDASVDLLAGLVAEAGLNGRRADVAQVLLAGVDFPEEEHRLHAALEPRAWARRLRVGNDTFALLRAGTDRGWGIAVVCGAGINCVGVAPDGRHVRFPALGTITGDWGGGYDVGLAAIWAAARSEDGRGPKTVLEQLVPRHFGVDTPLDLSLAIHTGRVEQRRAVELAPLVLATAADDPVADGIVVRLAGEVVALVRATATRLRLSDIDVVLGGGMMRGATDRLLALIHEGLADLELTLVRASAPPIVGAALLALDELGVTDEVRARARREIEEAF
ncbi:MAG TPA: BadF/BadG/BcrA/BcrD ATPase family protein [Gaiellaceae bacterium]|nr:BadF/BadG/BcrA/BcrD ATPase family protein [Gaiellaceae bacterium]